MSNYVNSKLPLFNSYIKNLLKAVEQEALDNKTNKDNKDNKDNKVNNKYNKNINSDTALFMNEVLSKVGEKFIINVCVHNFLVISIHQNTYHDDYHNYTNLLTISIKMGKNLFRNIYLS